MRKINLIRLKNVAPAVLLCAMLGACGMLSPVPQPQIIDYQLAADTSVMPECKLNPNAPILQVAEVKADAPFNTRKMYYSEAQYQLNSYSLNQWAARPDVMLTQAIQEKLLASCIYGNVSSNEFMTTAKYRLNSQLLDFKQVINDQSSTMQFNMLVQLVDNSSNQVVRSKTFVTSQAVESSPAGYVKGANAVTQTFLNELVTWLSSN